MPVVLQLESDPTRLTSKACNTKSHCLSSLSWFRNPGMVPGRPEDLRVKLLRITFAGTALPRTSRKLGEDPSFLHLPEPGSWGHSLELILHQWQHGSNSGRDPEVSFFFVCTNPVSVFLNSGIWIRQKKKKKNEGFSRLEKLSRELCTTIAISQEILSSPACAFQQGTFKQ